MLFAIPSRWGYHRLIMTPTGMIDVPALPTAKTTP